MHNYYQILGVNPSATESEIRRAYRILARRYHPDLNPGKQAEEKFKLIAEGYQVLCDIAKRRALDLELERAVKQSQDKRYQAYQRAQADNNNSSSKSSAAKQYHQAQQADYERIKAYQELQKKRIQKKSKNNFIQAVKDSWQKNFAEIKKIAQTPIQIKNKPKKNNISNKQSHNVQKISIIEVSVTMVDVLLGVQKTIEIEEPEGIRRIRVKIPAGVRSGSIVRMRSNSNQQEELVLAIRVAQHTQLSIDSRGLIVSTPITLKEAICGASIIVPTFDSEQISLKIPPGSQSGEELRVRGKGIPDASGRGDILYRLQILLPNENVSISSTVQQIEESYNQPIRQNLAKSILEIAKQ